MGMRLEKVLFLVGICAMAQLLDALDAGRLHVFFLQHPLAGRWRSPQPLD